jgi:biotin transporter BioY
MDVLSLAYVPFALLAGFILHFTVFRSRAQSRPAASFARRLTAVIVPLLCLTVWIALCYGFKLLTWKPFAGDAPGSISLTNVLLIVGSALTGMWISLRVRSRQATPRL